MASKKKATKKSRKAGGGKLSRSEVVSIRLDPKLRFAAELAAGKERRTLSSFIEWAIEGAVKKIHVTERDYEDGKGDTPLSAFDVVDEVWDIDECERFLKFSVVYFDLLTFDEQRLRKLLDDCGIFWPPQPDENKRYRLYGGRDKGETLELLGKDWEILKQVANGDLTKENLPKWIRPKKNK